MTKKTGIETIRRHRHQRGIMAEIIAACWLQLKAYQILHRRYKTPVGEIDLVARRGQTLVFVEVKSRHTHDAAAAALHMHNQKRIIRAAGYYLVAHPQFNGYTMRFDAMLLSGRLRPPKHIVQAFDAN